jgi:hypothetical protein
MSKDIEPIGGGMRGAMGPEGINAELSDTISLEELEKKLDQKLEEAVAMCRRAEELKKRWLAMSHEERLSAFARLHGVKIDVTTP